MKRPKPVRPRPGQESVWDYPRPPRIERITKRILVLFAEEVVADTRRAIRYLETSHPPCYFVPAEDVNRGLLVLSERTSYCEWRGYATYFHVRVGERLAEDAAWTYRHPRAAYLDLADRFAFFPRKMDECCVDGERATPQPGDFYGGWVTRDIVGPFKGEPGSLGW